jgi:RNA polymerase sigma-70 factor (ECF subfamily)
MADDATLTMLALDARAGDRQAANEFVRQTYQQVWRMLVALSNRRVAEDLTQETYTRAFRSLPGFRAEASARTWLLSIARRVAADHLRTNRARPQIDVNPDPHDPAAAGDLSESVALRSLVQRLDPDRRVAFVLTQLIGLSYLEAARICDCPVGTIRSRVARARDELAAGASPESRARDDRTGHRRDAST